MRSTSSTCDSSLLTHATKQGPSTSVGSSRAGKEHEKRRSGTHAKVPVLLDITVNMEAWSFNSLIWPSPISAPELLSGSEPLDTRRGKMVQYNCCNLCDSLLLSSTDLSEAVQVCR